MRVWLVLDDGMKVPIRLKLPPYREVWFGVGWEEVWLEVEEGSQPVDIWQGRAKGGDVQMEVRGRLGGNVAQGVWFEGKSLFRAKEGVWFEVREGVQSIVEDVHLA